MIIYDDRSWVGVIFTWTGSVLPVVWPRILLLVLVIYGAYELLGWQHWRFDMMEEAEKNLQMLGGTMSFLLIFRANQANARYWEGRTYISRFFEDIRDYVMFFNLYIRGGRRTVNWDCGNKLEVIEEDDNDELARRARITAVRLCVAFAVMLKTHTRLQHSGYCFGRISRRTKWAVDWDRFRLRQLLKDWEFRTVDSHFNILCSQSTTLQEFEQQFQNYDEGPPPDWPSHFKVNTEPAARAHLALAYLIKENLVMNMNDAFNSLPHGLKERLVPLMASLLKSALDSYEGVTVIISTPLPLPYVSLCKLLLTVWMVLFPLTEDPSLGLFGGVMVPIFVMLALLGIDAISTELEDPFGDDANDLDISEHIASLESEALALLELSGDVKARDAFVWRRLPRLIAEESCKPIYRQLVLAELAGQELVEATGESVRLGMDRDRTDEFAAAPSAAPARSYSGTRLDEDP